MKYRVPTLTLDTFVKKKRIKSIDLLKVDIDGSEYEFLQGAKTTLKENKIKTRNNNVIKQEKAWFEVANEPRESNFFFTNKI